LFKYTFVIHFTCYPQTTARKSNENEDPIETIQFLECACKVIIPNDPFLYVYRLVDSSSPVIHKSTSRKK
jgi:hypothetical protein